jgi:hypothetical protein
LRDWLRSGDKTNARLHNEFDQSERDHSPRRRKVARQQGTSPSPSHLLSCPDSPMLETASLACPTAAIPPAHTRGNHFPALRAASGSTVFLLPRPLTRTAGQPLVSVGSPHTCRPRSQQPAAAATSKPCPWFIFESAAPGLPLPATDDIVSFVSWAESLLVHPQGFLDCLTPMLYAAQSSWPERMQGLGGTRRAAHGHVGASLFTCE